MRKRTVFLIGLCVLVLVFAVGSGLVEAASNANIIDQGVGLSSVDSTLKQLARGIVRLARPIVAIMTAIAGVMVILNIGDSKRPMWNAILGIGLVVNFGDVLWSMWGKYADPQMGLESAIEYSLRIKDTTNADGNGVDILSTFMKYYLEIVVTGAERIKPIAIKLLLVLALIDSSIRLALDLTEKDKVSWLVKTFLRIGFYVFLIQNWIGIDGLNLMDTLSRGFQEIGFVAGNYGQALPTSVTDISSIDPKDNLSPDSIVNNGFKMVSAIFGASGGTESAGTLDSAKKIVGGAVGLFATGGLGPLTVIITVVVSILCIFLTGIEMFMARIEFYTLALVGLPLLAFGVIKHFEYLAQQTIRAMFNCGVKLCVISFLQAIVCRMFTKYINNVVDAQTGLFKDWHIVDNYGHLLATLFQLMLVSIIMYLLVSKIPKLIQGLLSGNPSLGGSDMTGTVTGAASTAATTAAMVAGAGTAAAQAKLDKAANKDVAPWKMSEMGQFAAALMRRAPITGSAYSAYNEIANFNKNDNQGNRDAPKRKIHDLGGADVEAKPSPSVLYRSPSASSRSHQKTGKFKGVGRRAEGGRPAPTPGPRLYPPRKETEDDE